VALVTQYREQQVMNEAESGVGHRLFTLFRTKIETGYSSTIYNEGLG
jgi:hypothetical protein